MPSGINNWAREEAGVAVIGELPDQLGRFQFVKAPFAEPTMNRSNHLCAAVDERHGKGRRRLHQLANGPGSCIVQVEPGEVCCVEVHALSFHPDRPR